MTTASEFLSGRPIAVDPARIERELCRLWKPSSEPTAEGQVTRACVANVVVSLPAPEAVERAAEDLPHLAARHPSRMVLMLSDPEAEARLGAWVTAVCSVPGRGLPPVCCEQITLRTRPGCAELFPSTVRSLLVPDVTTTLLCAYGEFGEAERQLLDVVDQVVFDSRLGPVPRAAARSACRVDDLVWYETRPWRQFLADLFDEESLRPALEGVVRIEARLAGSGATIRRRLVAAGALLAGWLCSRLGRRSVRAGGTSSGSEHSVEVGGEGAEASIEVRLGAEETRGLEDGALTSLRLLGTGHTELDLLVRCDGEPPSLHVSGATGSACVLPRSAPIRVTTRARLLGRVLTEPEPDLRVYDAASAVAEAILAGLAD